jgi:hypothetical protein
MSNISIPADAVRILRNAVHTEIGQDAYEIQSVSETGQGDANPEQYAGPLKRFDAHRALLDAIGWRKPDSDEPVQIDAERHRAVLVSTLERRLAVERDLAHESDPSLKGADRQRQTAEGYARTIEGFLRTLYGHTS